MCTNRGPVCGIPLMEECGGVPPHTWRGSHQSWYLLVAQSGGLPVAVIITSESESSIIY